MRQNTHMTNSFGMSIKGVGLLGVLHGSTSYVDNCIMIIEVAQLLR